MVRNPFKCSLSLLYWVLGSNHNLMIYVFLFLSQAFWTGADAGLAPDCCGKSPVTQHKNAITLFFLISCIEKVKLILLLQCLQTDWTNKQCLYSWSASGSWGQHRTWMCSTEGRRWSVSSRRLRTLTSWAPFSPCCGTSVTCRYHLWPVVYLSSSSVNVSLTNGLCLCTLDSFAQDVSLVHQHDQLAEPLQGQSDRQNWHATC